MARLGHLRVVRPPAPLCGRNPPNFKRLAGCPLRKELVMKISLLNTMAASAVFAAVTSYTITPATAAPAASEDIVAVASGNSDFSTLVAALTAAELVEVLDQLLQPRIVLSDDGFPYFFELVNILGGEGRDFLALGRPVDEFHEVQAIFHLKGFVGPEDHAGQVGVSTRLHKVE